MMRLDAVFLTEYWSRPFRIGMAVDTASVLSLDSPRHMCAAVATATLCTPVWKKSRYDSTCTSEPVIAHQNKTLQAEVHA